MEDYMFTSAIFTEVSPVALEKILKVLDSHIRVIEKWRGNDFYYQTYAEIGVTIKIKEKIFKLTGFHITRWGNLSIYLESDDLLIRISDHWSSGSAVRNCGSIKTCEWQLHARSNTVIRFKNSRVQGGFCKKTQLLASKE